METIGMSTRGTTPDGTAYCMSGPDGAPAVVLIHGVGLNQAVWQWMEPVLADRYRVLTYDFIGHGMSAPPEGGPVLRDLADQLRRLLDHLDIAHAAIVGFSLGGMIARRFAQDHPERTAALVILHSPHRRTPEAQAAIVARVEQTIQSGPPATVEAALVRWFSDACRAQNPGLIALVRSWVLANDPAVYPKLYRILAEGIEEVVAPDPALACPALVLTGDEDYGNGPEFAAAIAAEMPNSRVVILTGLRHMALAEKPEAVNGPVFAFLQEVLR